MGMHDSWQQMVHCVLVHFFSIQNIFHYDGESLFIHET